jgi:hypothetical protein
MRFYVLSISLPRQGSLHCWQALGRTTDTLSPIGQNGWISAAGNIRLLAMKVIPGPKFRSRQTLDGTKVKLEPASSSESPVFRIDLPMIRPRPLRMVAVDDVCMPVAIAMWPGCAIGKMRVTCTEIVVRVLNFVGVLRRPQGSCRHGP